MIENHFSLPKWKGDLESISDDFEYDEHDLVGLRRRLSND